MQLYNSFSKSIENAVFDNDKTIRMYVCGVTPYDTTHMGHAFTYVFFDTLKRYLTYLGYKVLYTQNVTDVDDDLLKRARQVKTNWQELAATWTDRYLSDMKSLNVQDPTFFIKASDSIPEIIELVSKLKKKNYAYEAGGNVYFDTSIYSTYGELSHLKDVEMVNFSRERGADPDDKRKKNPLDFILWQKSLPDEPKWDSPFGAGRPGWHIECSSMIRKTLGDQIDIHGGGFDLIFPHHESERAQSESATGKTPFVRYWLHTAMVHFEKEKMSKSLGNMVHVTDLLKKYSPESIRYVLLSHHYRTIWEFDEDELAPAEIEVEKLRKAYKSLSIKDEGIFNGSMEGIEMLDCDMQTPDALTRLLELAKQATSKKIDSEIRKEFKDLIGILGFTF